MTENKIPASLILIIIILLVVGLLIANGISRMAVSVVTNSVTSPETNVVDSKAQVLVPKGIVINELMADNDRAVQSAYGGYPDWIELYNSGDTAVDLSGMYLTDDLSNPRWKFPNGTVIEPNNYLLLWADADTGRGALQVNFNLRANGGTVALFASDGTTLIDLVVYNKQIRDVSYGRIPDGSSNWDYMTIPTPSKANVANPRAITSTPWQIWLLIALAIVVCVAVVLKDKIQARRQK